jgi:hypothetical protein
LTVPVPLPVKPELMMIQEAVLVAVQAQPALVVRFMLPLPPLAANEALLGESEKEQTGAVAAPTGPA